MRKRYHVEKKGEFTYYQNEDGALLGTCDIPVLEQDGYVFKDLARTGKLVDFEDWRLPAQKRAADLAGRLSVEEIAGLMLYSSHQLVPFVNQGPFQGHYHGRSFDPETDKKWELTDEQKEFLTKDHLRHVLLMHVEDAGTSARWSNELQKTAEKEKWGIPVNISTDPRHGAGSGGQEYKTAAGVVSAWPEGIGMTATRSEKMWRSYARAAAKEYRAMGITTALGPQVDLATEPRWMRLEDTWGGDLSTSVRMASVICSEMQTTKGEPDGWGKDSVAVMAKHWPGGGTGEGGRDAHYGFGKFAVYPGGAFAEHTKVFTEGALKLEGPTGQVAAIMPYYTVSWGQDIEDKENVGNSYSRYLVHELLRETYDYDGVLCTDWGITGDQDSEIDSFTARSYGVEALSVAERHLRIIMNGVDQFGGNNEAGPILEAYEIGCGRYGKSVMDGIMRNAARRLLTNIFRLGLFENPYLDPQESEAIVGCEAFRAEGKLAQRASVVLLKNRNQILPLKKGIKVYVPERQLGEGKNFFRTTVPGKRIRPVPEEVTENYFILTNQPEDADAAIVFVESPLSDGYSRDDREDGGNGYLPISLQYRPYTAVNAREVSIASGDFREKEGNRSYRGKVGRCTNEADLDIILNTRSAMKEKPVIVVMRMHNPAIVREFEPQADGILAEFGVEPDAILDVIFGEFTPVGKLPVRLPKSMETVERHKEDLAYDYEAYKDEMGNVYEFGFGL